MKKITLALFFISCCFSCQKKVTAVTSKSGYASFGDSISAAGAISKEELFAKYAALNEGDTVNVKFISKINDVCQKKGCWMNLAMVNDDEVFVKFKDYAFFMPLNSKGSDVIVNGKAFLSVESVAELQHYAKDAGKAQAAIDSIKTPKTSYGFIADGVLLKQ